MSHTHQILAMYLSNYLLTHTAYTHTHLYVYYIYLFTYYFSLNYLNFHFNVLYTDFHAMHNNVKGNMIINTYMTLLKKALEYFTTILTSFMLFDVFYKN